MTSHSLLQRVRIASPCHQSWAQMSGDERRRFCASCQKHVYNFAGMREQEIEALLRAHEGNLCARLHRRADGTILTADCPVGLRNASRRMRRWLAAATGLVFAGLATVFAVPRLARIGADSDGSSSRLVRYVGAKVSAFRIWIGLDDPPIFVRGAIFIYDDAMEIKTGNADSSTSSDSEAEVAPQRK
ncbi:MAG: hypothetical protein ACKVX7_04380 [Planctomycetota bacterium]